MTNLRRVLDVTIETKKIANEVVPIIVEIPINNENLRYLLCRLLELIEGITFSDDVSINELAQNNYEFLDTLRASVLQLLSCSQRRVLPIFDREHLESVLHRIDVLISELNSPLFLKDQTLNRRNFTDHKSDEDLTESRKEIFTFLCFSR